MPFRYFKLVYDSSGRADIQRGVVVGVCLMAARSTKKLCLVLAVGFFAVAAPRTSPTRVARIDRDQDHAVKLGLVFDERPQLSECPAAHFSSLLLSEPCPAANSLKVFKGDSAAGAFGRSDDVLADDVVDVPLESGFSIADSSHGSAGILPSPTFEYPVHSAAERSTNAVALLPDSLDSLSADAFAIARGRQIGNTEIDPDKLLNVDRCIFGQVDRTEQVELTVSVDEIALTLNAIEASLLVFTVDHGHDLASGERQKADLIEALEAHQTLIVGHRAGGPKFRAAGLVALKAFDRLADRANCHLARQSKSLAKLIVAQRVNRRLTESLGVKARLGSERGGGVERLHCVEQQAFLLGGWQESKLERQLHGINIRTKSIHNKGQRLSAIA